jgi:hypothetical protein
VKGRRLPDLPMNKLHDDRQPGDYWRVTTEDGTPIEIVDTPSNLTGGEWYVVTPNGLLGHLMLHTVREEDDGTISVRPDDGSTNSILVTQREDERWHGYIEHGVWNEIVE